MGELVKGDVVVLPFPFSDLSSSKKRPALIMAILDRGDVLLCQITSKLKEDIYAVKLADSDFKHGKLDVESRIRPNRIFTGNKSRILYKIGSIKESKTQDVIKKIMEILNQ